jgi:hypothetical protein
MKIVAMTLGVVAVMFLSNCAEIPYDRYYDDANDRGACRSYYHDSFYCW